MNRPLPYWHVDAFASRPFSGNPAAVMLLESWPDDSVLLAIAAENNFSETAFCVRDECGSADWELRWFTPKMEVALCGHATLASGHVLMERDRDAGSVKFSTRKSGALEVVRIAQGYELSLPGFQAGSGTFSEFAALGSAPGDVRSHPGGYHLLIYADEAEVRALSPDFRALGAFGDDMFIATAPGDSADVVSRVFVPGVGVDEDPVTGSAHAVLAPYWAERLGKKSFTAFQASARGGLIRCRVEGERVWLGGSCVTVVKGEFFI